MRSIYFYKVDNEKIICVKKIGNTINFIDVKTDGIDFRRNERITKTKVTRIPSPATRPLSSGAVDSARNAWQDGKPNPKDNPATLPQTMRNSSP